MRRGLYHPHGLLGSLRERRKLPNGAADVFNTETRIIGCSRMAEPQDKNIGGSSSSGPTKSAPIRRGVYPPTKFTLLYVKV